MKAIKNTCAALLSLLLLVGFASCSEEEAAYSAAKKLQTAQVYFSNTMATTIEVDKAASSVNIPVYRALPEGEVTVAIDATCSSTEYTIPSSVTFADTSDVAYLTISYNGDNLEYGEFADITLALADSTQATPYGRATFVGQIGVAEPWTVWEHFNSAATCTWMDNTGWMSGKQTDREFLIHQNTISTNKYQFMMKDALNGCDLIFDYDAETGYLKCDGQYCGYTDSSYGDVYVCDYNYYMHDVKGGDIDDEMWGTFDAENGIIDVYLVFYVSEGVFTNGWEQIQLDGYTRLDTSIGVSYTGKLIDPNDNVSTCVNVELGADVTRALVTLVPMAPGNLTDDIVKAIVEGTTEYPVQEITASGEVRFSMEGMAEGTYTVLAVSFIGQEPQKLGYTSFDYTTSGAAQWVSKYIGDYTYTLWFTNEDGTPAVDTDLELWQNENNDEQFKLTHWGYDVDFKFSFSSNGVMVKDQETGYVHSQVGMIYVDDLVDYTGSTQYGQSSYDPQTGAFNFAVVYYYISGDEYKVINYGVETFQITEEQEEAKARVDAAYYKSLGKKSFKKELTHKRILRHSGIKKNAWAKIK